MNGIRIPLGAHTDLSCMVRPTFFGAPRVLARPTVCATGPAVRMCVIACITNWTRDGMREGIDVKIEIGASTLTNDV